MSESQTETKHTPRTPENPQVLRAQTHTHTPNPFGPEAYYKSLPDTEANRKILSCWTDQNARAQRAQWQLFSRVQEPVQSPQAELKIFESETTIVTNPLPETPRSVLKVSEMSSEMNSGGNPSRISTSKGNFNTIISSSGAKPSADSDHQHSPDFRSFPCQLQQRFQDLKGVSEMISEGSRSRISTSKGNFNTIISSVGAKPTADYVQQHNSPAQSSTNSPAQISDRFVGIHFQLPTSNFKHPASNVQFPASESNLHPSPDFESFVRKRHQRFPDFKRHIVRITLWGECNALVDSPSFPFTLCLLDPD